MSLSSSDDRWEFCELVRTVYGARQRYSDTTHEVGRLERCLNTVGVALIASERETVVAQAVIIDA